MKKRYFRTNEDYFKFINKYKDLIEVIELSFTKTRQIKLTYDII